MKDSTRDQLQGKAHEMKGAVKEAVGKAAKDSKLQSQGNAEKVAGKVQSKIGQIKKVFDK